MAAPSLKKRKKIINQSSSRGMWTWTAWGAAWSEPPKGRGGEDVAAARTVDLLWLRVANPRQIGRSLKLLYQSHTYQTMEEVARRPLVRTHWWCCPCRIRYLSEGRTMPPSMRHWIRTGSLLAVGVRRGWDARRRRRGRRAPRTRAARPRNDAWIHGAVQIPPGSTAGCANEARARNAHHWGSAAALAQLPTTFPISSPKWGLKQKKEGPSVQGWPSRWVGAPPTAGRSGTASALAESQGRRRRRRPIESTPIWGYYL
jgi:hypothetical protein